MKRIGNVNFNENGGAWVQGLIQEAVARGDRFCTVTGNWEMEQTVRIPSDFALILDNCHLRQADGVICNMFTNEHLEENGDDFDITIEGRGRVILDGGEPNGLNERTRRATPEKWPEVKSVTENSLIRMAHVDGIRISGLHLRNQRYWALTFVYCCRGVLRDLDFRSNDTRVTADGQHVHGLLRSDYEGCLVKNSDGIDLRCGCHDFQIRGITGFTQDDTVALTALWGATEQAFWKEGCRKEICNVVIRDVNAAAYCATVRLLNGDGILLHDILIDGVFDAMRDNRFADGGDHHVRIGDTHLYGKTRPMPGEVYNITVRNVHGLGRQPAVHVACHVDNLTVETSYRGEEA